MPSFPKMLFSQSSSRNLRLYRISSSPLCPPCCATFSSLEQVDVYLKYRLLSFVSFKRLWKIGRRKAESMALICTLPSLIFSPLRQLYFQPTINHIRHDAVRIVVHRPSNSGFLGLRPLLKLRVNGACYDVQLTRHSLRITYA